MFVEYISLPWLRFMHFPLQNTRIFFHSAYITPDAISTKGINTTGSAIFSHSLVSENKHLT